MKRTKIVCTIGPATETEASLRALLQAGMNVARLNFSHGTHEWHRERISLLRKISAETGQAVGVLMDLCGPKMRLGKMPEEGIPLPAGSYCRLGPGPSETGAEPRLEVPLPMLLERLAPGDPVYLRDAQLHLEVVERLKDELRCKVITGGTIFGRQGITAPTVFLPVPAATEKDLQDLRAAGSLVDWVALSFVRQPSDLGPVRALLEEIGSPARLMAKIEKPQALDNFEAILEMADGIMIARGDLGVEIPLARVPMVQKRIIHRCNAVGKPVITATQMLETMMTQPRPTRAEVTDVANAILDGTDAVMLSGETAAGQYPVQAVEMMTAVARSAEEHFPYAEVLRNRLQDLSRTLNDALAQGVCEMASDLKVAAIVVGSDTGATARAVARLRPAQPVLAVTPHGTTAGQLALSWGVVPILTLEDNLARVAQVQGLETGCLIAMLRDHGRSVELAEL